MFEYIHILIYREMNVLLPEEIVLRMFVFNVLHLMVQVRTQYWKQVIAITKFIPMLHGYAIFLGCDKLHALIVLLFATL